MRYFLIILIAIAVIFGGTYYHAHHGLIELTSAEQENAPGKFLKIPEYGRLHYIDVKPSGKPKKTIILVHGFSTPHFVYEKQIPALVADGYRVVAFDHFGRGWSDRPHVKYNADLYQDSLSAIVSHIETESGETEFGLIGLSMGGPIVTEYAVNHPEKIWKLGYIVPAGFDLGAEEQKIGQALIKSPIIGDWLWHVVVKNQMLNDPQYDDSAYPLDRRLQNDPTIQFQYHGYWRSLLSTLRHFDMANSAAIYQQLADQDFAIAAIFGDVDTTVLISSAEKMAQAAPNIEITRMAEGNHALNIRHPQKTNDWLLNFLNGE